MKRALATAIVTLVALSPAAVASAQAPTTTVVCFRTDCPRYELARVTARQVRDYTARGWTCEHTHGRIWTCTRPITYTGHGR